MSEDIDDIKKELWAKLQRPKYRESFASAQLTTTIVAQIQTMREARKWSQKELAEKAGMSPARISVMENPNYDKFTLTTLKRLAAAFDVAPVFRFMSFSDVVNWTSDLTPGKLDALSFKDDSFSRPMNIGTHLPTVPQQVALQQSVMGVTTGTIYDMPYCQGGIGYTVVSGQSQIPSVWGTASASGSVPQSEQKVSSAQTIPTPSLAPTWQHQPAPMSQRFS